MKTTMELRNVNAKKFIGVALVIALLIAMIVPLRAMGSEEKEGNIKVGFQINGKKYEEVSFAGPDGEDTTEPVHFDSSKYPKDPEPEDGYEFDGWEINGQIYTKDSDPQFVIEPGENINPSAVFNKIEESDSDSNSDSDAENATDENNDIDEENVSGEGIKTDDIKKNNKKNKVSPSASDEVTVKFVTENDEEYATKKVIKNTLLDSWPDNPQPKGDSAFLYWYDVKEAESGTKVPFNKNYMIKEDITLKAEFNEGYLVTFYDIDGTVLDVVPVNKGEKATETKKSPELMTGENLVGWYYLEDENKVDYDFDSDVTNNLKLYPKVTKNAVVYFITNGTYMDPVIVAKGSTISKPAKEPTRDGYDFAGWTDKIGGTDEFDFTKNIDEDVTYVYAKWTPKSVSYTINIWNEKTNISGDPGAPALNPGNYELICSTTKAAMADSFIGCSSKDADTIYAAKGANVANILNYSDYFSSENKLIKGDGSTVINVYYKRTSFEFCFDATKFANNGTVKTNDPGATFKITDTAISYYAITLKLGENTNNKWPKDFKRSDSEANVASNWDGYAGFNTDGHSRTISAGDINQYWNGGYKINKRPVKSGAKWDVARNLFTTKCTAVIIKKNFTEERWYYTEILEGESTEGAIEFTIKGTNDKRYYKYAQKSGINYQSNSPLSSAGGWPGREIEGFMAIDDKVTHNGRLSKITNFQQVIAKEGGDPKKDFVIKYFMPRLKKELVIYPNNGTLDEQAMKDAGFTQKGNAWSKDVQFGADLTTMAAPEPKDSGYKFEGWYSDSDFSASNKVDFSKKSTMPASQISLYARYVGADATVEYFDGDELVSSIKTNIGETIGPTPSAKGGIDYSSLKIGNAVAGKGTFKGWFYKPVANGSMVNFYYDSSNHLKVMQDSYQVYARWDAVNLKLNYVKVDDGVTTTMGSVTLKSTKNTLGKSQMNLLPTGEIYGWTYSWNTSKNLDGAKFTAATPIAGDTTVYLKREINKYEVSFDAMGGAENPASQKVTYKDKATTPEAVTKEDWIFSGWTDKKADAEAATKVINTDYKGSKWSFQDEPVIKDTVLYAIWTMKEKADDTGGVDTPIGVPETTEEAADIGTGDVAYPDDSDTDNDDKGSNGSGNNNGGETNANDDGDTIVGDAGEDEGIDTVNLDKDKTPLTYGNTNSTWAILNLILAVGGAIMTLILMAVAVVKRNKEDDESTSTNNEKAHKYRPALIAGTAVLALVGVIMFLLTEDMSLPTALMDNYTVFHAVIFGVEAILGAVAFKAKSLDIQDYE